MPNVTGIALRHLLGVLSAAQISLGISGVPAAAEDETIAKLRAADRKSFTDQEIISGFLKLTFDPEFPFMGRVDRVRKFGGPIRIHIENRAKLDRSEHAKAVISDISARIQHLDMTVIEKRRDANLLVTLISDRDLPRTIRMLQNRKPTKDIQRSLQARCLSEIRRDAAFRIVRSDTFVVADAGEFAFYDCAYVKLLRALGPVNDDPTLPWTMFNDEVHKGFFGVYDQYLLNILYDRRILPGMTEAQVRAVLPAVLPSVRAFVAKVNKLPR